MAKALRAGADAVVLDLEDAVAPADKLAARNDVAAIIAAGVTTSCEVHVRVNRTPAGVDFDDVAAVVTRGLTGLRVPKATAAEELRVLAARLDEFEARAGIPTGEVAVYPIVESAAGVAGAAELAAAPRVARLAFGATDFLADISASGEPDGPATLMARGTLVLASRVAGIGAPIDAVHTALDDEVGVRRSAEAARALGFFGKSVIHPRQVAAVHEAFAPSAAELGRARRIVDRASEPGGDGASELDGELVDPAVVARARATLTMASRERR